MAAEVIGALLTMLLPCLAQQHTMMLSVAVHQVQCNHNHLHAVLQLQLSEVREQELQLVWGHGRQASIWGLDVANSRSKGVLKQCMQ